MKELVSVIIPVWNSEKFLDRCIESVVEQTYKNLEIILVDDGSTDRSPSICDGWAKKDSRIKVVHIHNGGSSVARNAGLDMFNGDYVSFVDSDDYIDKQYVEILYANLRATKSDISIGSVYRVDSRGYKYVWLKLRDESNDTKIFIENLPAPIYSPCYKLAKRAVFNNIRYPVGKLSEDAFISIETLFNSKRICSTNKCIYYYFNNIDSISHIITPKKYTDIFRSRDHVVRELFNRNIRSKVFYSFFNDFVSQYVISYKELRRLKSSVDARNIRKEYKLTIRLFYKSLNIKNKIKAKVPVLYLFCKRIAKRLYKSIIAKIKK